MNIAHPAAETLESRIAPAAVLKLVDVDGDLITITSSKGTNAQLAAIVSTSSPGGSVAGGVAIDTIGLSNDPIFDGTNLSVMAKPGPLGGDGLVNVESIVADNQIPGSITVDGDLQNFDAGNNTPGGKVKAINLNSTSGIRIWTLTCNVGVLNVLQDLRGAEIDLTLVNGKLDLLKIGGSLIGESGVNTGFISSQAGTIGKVVVKGDIIGGIGDSSGAITAENIGSMRIGGSLIGGTNASSTGSGFIEVQDSLGALIVNGSILGGVAARSGLVNSLGGIGNVTLGGSLVGGAGDTSGAISATDSLGAVKIGRDVLGGTDSNTGRINATTIASIKIGGNLVAGTSSNSGAVAAGSGGLGSVKIGGSVIGGGFTSSGGVSSAGSIGNVRVGGDILVGTAPSARINAQKTLGAVTVGGNVIGISIFTPAIQGSVIPGGSQLAIKSITVGGRVDHASITTPSADGQIGPVKVGGDWIACQLTTGIDSGPDFQLGTADDVVTPGGDPALFSKIASIAIGGRVFGTDGGGDHFGFVSQQIGAMTVNGAKILLQAGRSNDTNINNTHFILGASRDVTVHEVA